MTDLLKFILTKITGGGDFEIKEEVDGNHTNLIVSVSPPIIGLIIGKGGKTIRAIRNVLRVRATLEKRGISLAIEEKATS